MSFPQTSYEIYCVRQKQLQYFRELFHHGVKGQKWGIRNGPPYPIKRNVVKIGESDIIKSVNSSHKSNPKNGQPPNSVMDQVDENGKVLVRTYYDENGWKKDEVHTTDHGNPKMHPYGKAGEHLESYEWDQNGSLLRIAKRDLTENERRENKDIL